MEAGVDPPPTGRRADLIGDIVWGVVGVLVCVVCGVAAAVGGFLLGVWVAAALGAPRWVAAEAVTRDTDALVPAVLFGGVIVPGLMGALVVGAGHPVRWAGAVLAAAAGVSLVVVACSPTQQWVGSAVGGSGGVLAGLLAAALLAWLRRMLRAG